MSRQHCPILQIRLLEAWMLIGWPKTITIKGGDCSPERLDKRPRGTQHRASGRAGQTPGLSVSRIRILSPDQLHRVGTCCCQAPCAGPTLPLLISFSQQSSELESAAPFVFFFFFNTFIYLFIIFGCVGSLLLRAGFFGCGEWGLLLLRSMGSRSPGFSSCGTWAQ